MRTTSPPPLVLTHPTSARPSCPACGKQVKDMSRHAGSAHCKNESRKAMIARLGLIEVWWREREVLRDGHVPVVVIRDQSGHKDRRHWFASPEPVDAVRALIQAGIEDKRLARLLRGPKEELERSLALAALAGQREAQHSSAHAVVQPGGGVQLLATPVGSP